MAQRLTWQNVAAPDFSAAAQIMSQAGKQIEQGTGNIADLFADARKRQIDTRSSEALGQLAGIDGSGNADAILQQVLASTAPKDRNVLLNSAIAETQKNALGLDNTRSQINTREAQLALNQNADGRAATRLGMDQTTHNRRIENEDAEDAFARAYAGGYTGRYTGDTTVALGQDSAFSSHISSTESGGAPDQYDTLYGHRNRQNGVRVSEMTIGEAGRFAAVNGEYGQAVKGAIGRVATPMGKFQIVGTTLRKMQSDLGLPDNLPFSPAVQEQMGMYLAQQRVNGPRSIENMRKGLRNEWEGFKKLSNKELDDIIAEVRNAPAVDRESIIAAGQGQQGSADIRGGTLSSLLPKGGRFTFDQMTKFQDRLSKDQTAAEARVTEQMRTRVQEQVYSRIQELGPNQPLQTLRNEILGSNMSPVEKEMFLQEATRILGENEGYFSPLGGSALETLEVQHEISDIMGTIDVYNAAAEIYNPSAAQYGSITVNGNSVDTADAGGTPRINNSGSLAAQISELESVLATEDDPRPIDRDSLLATVQRISEVTGLPAQVVMSAAKNSLTNASWLNNKITVDEDILLGNLAPYLTNGSADPHALELAASNHRQRERLTADAGRITSQMDAIATEHAVFSDRPDSPEVRERLKVLGNQYNAQLAELRKIQEQARTAASVFDKPKKEPEQDTTVEDFVSSVISGANRGDPLQPVASDAVTPNGRTIDPNGTGFEQFVDRQQVTTEIARGVKGITTDLALDGGAIGPRVFGQIADFFTATPTEAAANKADRATRTEALKWFQSVEARNVLRRDPLLMVEAEDDPIGFWKKHSTSETRKPLIQSPERTQVSPTVNATAPVVPSPEEILSRAAKPDQPNQPAADQPFTPQKDNSTIQASQESIRRELLLSDLPLEMKPQAVEWFKQPKTKALMGSPEKLKEFFRIGATFFFLKYR